MINFGQSYKFPLNVGKSFAKLYSLAIDSLFFYYFLFINFLRLAKPSSYLFRSRSAFSLSISSASLLAIGQWLMNEFWWICSVWLNSSRFSCIIGIWSNCGVLKTSAVTNISPFCATFSSTIVWLLERCVIVWREFPWYFQRFRLALACLLFLQNHILMEGFLCSALSFVGSTFSAISII